MGVGMVDAVGVYCVLCGGDNFTVTFYPFEFKWRVDFWTSGGLFWSSCAAIVTAMGIYWRRMDREVKRGGVWYIFALRLLPLTLYGIVNYGAGLTSISSRH